MDLPDAIDCCLSLPQAEETTPFGPEVLVYKVRGRVFALAGFRNEAAELNVKGDPERSLELRDRFEGITPGYHMNKKHWNTVRLDGSVPATLVRELIAESYRLVVEGMTRKEREALEE